MTTPTPKTRRQLRAALESEKSRRQTFEDRAAGAQEKFDSLSEALEADGWTPKRGRGIYLFEQPPIVGWTAPDRSAEKNAVEATARRETLEKVIDGLKLSEYDYREPGAYYYGFRTDGDQRPGHERLWDDINTALEVRAEKKREDERQATAKKVAGLTEPKNPPFFTINSVDLVNGSIFADIDLSTRAPQGEPGSSYGAAQTLDKPKPKKKPAAKKGSKK